MEMRRLGGKKLTQLMLRQCVCLSLHGHGELPEFGGVAARDFLKAAEPDVIVSVSSSSCTEM